MIKEPNVRMRLHALFHESNPFNCMLFRLVALLNVSTKTNIAILVFDNKLPELTYPGFSPRLTLCHHNIHKHVGFIVVNLFGFVQPFSRKTLHVRIVKKLIGPGNQNIWLFE